MSLVHGSEEKPHEKQAEKVFVKTYSRASKLLQKKLLSNSNPNPCRSPTSASSNSVIQYQKKTRYAPNLSDCHCCGVKVPSDGTHKLQTLDSHWRVVLLCKKCIKLINSAQFCSYCFNRICDDDGIQCRQCKRRVHNDCVLKYKGFAPWSYCCLDSGFSVCVDCWVPKSAAGLNKADSVKSSKIASESCLMAKSRVSDAMEDAKVAAEKKIEEAAKAREKALKKAVVAKRAVELAYNAVNLVNRDETASKEFLLDTTAVVDDAQVAFRLHRAMNSSPRIFKNLSSTNLSLTSSVSDELEFLTCNTLLEDPDKTVSDPSVEIRAPNCDHCTDHVKIEQIERATQMGNIENFSVLKEEEGSCSNKLISSSGDDNSMDSELNPNDTNSQVQPRCDGNSTMPYDERSSKRTDRYSIKYSKKHAKNFKLIPDSEGCHLESQGSASELTLNFS